MGTPEFAVTSLARLVADGHSVEAAFTQPDKPAGRGNKLLQPPVKMFAVERGITVFQPARIKTNEEVRATFTRIAPDVCVVAAYGKILPEWMLSIPRLGCINVHASLLPKYRGAAPINWAIANGERETGVTIMQMDAGLDTGAMLSRRAVNIEDDETAAELSARLAELGAGLLTETLRRLELGDVRPVLQDNNEATYAPMLKREDGLIDWTQTASEIANRIRAFQPWPGCHTMLGHHRLIIWRAHTTSAQAADQPASRPATIIAMNKTGITVACGGDSALHIEELQIEGKRRLPARDVVNGLRLTTGQRISDD
jgi:methionyl-tRNA formyltransferase